MDAAGREKAKELFQRALLDRQVLEGASGAVRAEVEALLRVHDETAQAEESGGVVGRYKLLQRLGEGGFGVVWMAEQTEPVRRHVALKILKAGMDAGQVIARFEAERQALALMDHPSIAKVLDAGATPSGRPYFVMELVKGVPITQYCDDARLDTRGRLELFRKVCHAVQHAHQKGVVHRDLKPSNLLVTLHDGVPVPKVIDFGIAKATDQRLTERTLFTEFRQMIGTPDYMAPEQAEMSGLDVDTRADIYSLGVLLYELLTGTKPFDLRAAVQDGYAEILRTIREVDPPRPSNRVSTMGAELTPMAASRRTAPRQLGKLLRGDLDWIVMKALEKERGRRYDTANALAMDVGRHLADEPVLAGPPHALYRARKYARRHRLGVAAATLAGSALVAGVVLAFTGYVDAAGHRSRAQASLEQAAREAAAADHATAHERQQRTLADARETEARTRADQADAVLGLVRMMLSSASPHEARDPNYTVRALLDDFDRETGAMLGEQPEVEATVRLTMALAYLGLGLTDRAAPNVERAVAIRGTGERSAAFADALAARATLEHDRGRFEEAAATAREVVAVRRQGGDPLALADSLDALADMLRHVGRLDEAESAGREALALHRSLPRSDIAASLDTLASIRREQGALDEAEALLGEALATKRAKGGVELAACVSHLADVRCARRDLEGAERLEREALAILEGAVDREHPAVANVLVDLGSVLLARGDVAGAERCLLDGVEICRATGTGLAMPLVALGQALMAKRDLAGAEARLREALGASAEGEEKAAALGGLGWLLFVSGDARGAQDNLREALATLRRAAGEDHPGVSRTLDMLAQVLFLSGDRAGAKALALEEVKRHATHQLLALAGNALADEGRHAEAEPLLRECLAIREREMPDDWIRYSAMSLLGDCLAAQGKHAEAEPLLIEGYEKMRPPPPLAGRRGEALDRIVKLYEAWGKPEKAAEWRNGGASEAGR